jgi:peptidyl-prolyl cis-trans isomerase D
MLAFFRAFAKSWAAKLLFVALLFGFVLLGIGTGLVPKLSTDVITAGDRSVGAQQFKEDVQHKLNEARMQGAEIPPMDELVKLGYPQQIAQKKADEQAYLAWVAQTGVRPDKTRLRELLTRFVNPVTGVFDEAGFDRVLSENGLSKKVVLRDLSDQLAVRDLELATLQSVRTPNLFTALLVNHRMQTRDASFFALDPSNLGPAPTPTEAELQALYKDMRKRVPETRELTVVVFDPHKLAPSQTIDPAQVRKEFDFKKDTYSTPEKRAFDVVVVKDAKAAAQAAAALRAGQPADAAAKAAGGQSSTQAALPKTAIQEPKIAAAVFDLKQAGQVSDPIQGEGGFAVVKLTSITAGKPATFEEKRAEIEDGLRLTAAQDKIQDMVDKYAKLRDDGLSAADAGRKVGADVTDTPAVTREGATKDNAPVKISDNQALAGKILADGFAQTKPSTTQARKAGDTYYDVAVKAVHASYAPKFEEVRAQVVEEWSKRNAAQRVKAASADLLKRLEKGEPIDQVAASVHAQVEHKTGLQRPKRGQDDPLALATMIVFSQPKGAPFAEPMKEAVMLIGRVDAVHSPETASGAETVASARGQLDQDFAGALMETLRTAAVVQIKPKVDEPNLKAALGVADQPAPQR